MARVPLEDLPSNLVPTSDLPMELSASNIVPEDDLPSSIIKNCIKASKLGNLFQYANSIMSHMAYLLC